MAYIKEYWEEKIQREKQARLHTQKMTENYPNLISMSVANTKLYNADTKCEKTKRDKMEIAVENADSVTSVFTHAKNGKTAVLNFSSYKNPGGMFLNGSKAQEECLCHESFLYNVLSQFMIEFYDWNNNHKNKALYLNRALYSPNILFIREENSVSCDVITCAAPNKSAAQKYQNVSQQENLDVLKSRIKFVLDIAADNNVDTLILGAYGCGVFGQDAFEVANIFKEYLTTTHKCFNKVIFAIPNGKDGNFIKFKEIFA